MNIASLVPKVIIDIDDYPRLEIGGNDNVSIVKEMNFYSTLNSFSFNADVTIEDFDNDALNKLMEQHASKVILLLYEIPEKDPTGKLTTAIAKKVFQKTFSTDKIDVLEFGTSFPYKSIIKVHLKDTYESLILNKLMTFSNFNIEWTSDEMSPISTMHYILKKYEQYSKKLQVDEKIFGVDIENLKRRFATDQKTPIKDVFHAYIDSLYNTRWKEFLSKNQPELTMPKYLLAYSNQYQIDKDGILTRTPWLTCANILDNDPNNPIYSIPYVKDNPIFEFAHKDYNLNVEIAKIDLRGGPSAEIKNKIIADTFRKYTFNPNDGIFEDKIDKLDKIYPLCPDVQQDIESKQVPKYLGKGNDPTFEQKENILMSSFLKFPYNIKENQHFSSDGEKSFYQDACDLLLKPMVYVSIPYSAWHSPGQEIDLRMITTMYDEFKPNKNNFFSMNKLLSGRWKIINSMTTFQQQKENSSGFNITPIETLGLTRTRYFHGELPKNGEIKSYD